MSSLLEILALVALSGFFLVPYVIVQFTPPLVRNIAGIAALALVVTTQALRALPREYALYAIPIVLMVGAGTIAGAIMRAFGPADKIHPNRNYWITCSVVGVLLAWGFFVAAAMSTDGL